MRKLLLGATLTISTLAAFLVICSLLPRSAAGQHANQGTHLAAQSPSGVSLVLFPSAFNGLIA